MKTTEIILDPFTYDTRIEFQHEIPIQEVFGKACMTELPGLYRQIGWLHDSSIPSDYKNKGLGTKFHKERLDYLKEKGYIAALCAVFNWNTAEIKILEKFEWKKLGEIEFKNLGIWLKEFK